MVESIGIRREDKNRWERRTPIIPEHVSRMRGEHPFRFIAQPSPIRVFSDRDYLDAGADISEDLGSCKCVFGIKEVPQDLLLPGMVYIYFSHTIKGQSYNMPMLQRLLDLECTLIDYELLVDGKGRRLVFFGNYAGMAGMIDSLWALGQRLREEGHRTPFAAIRPAHEYRDLNAARAAVRGTGEEIGKNALPEPLCPLIFGFAGYGNVSRGAQEIFDIMPHREITPRDLLAPERKALSGRDILYKVVFKEEDMVVPAEAGKGFELQEYYEFPERYEGRFREYIPYLTVLMNCIYWTPRYPRLVTKKSLKELFRSPTPPPLRVIGDISCDVNGAVECTLKCTTPDRPVFVYDTKRDRVIDGVKGSGPVILAVDHLPCELPRESSSFFSGTLLPVVPDIVNVDYSKPFAEAGFKPVVKNAVIVYRGELTPGFAYLEKHLHG